MLSCRAKVNSSCEIIYSIYKKTNKMSDLRDLKLNDVEGGANLRSSSSSNESGSMEGGTLTEVVVTGSKTGSGSGSGRLGDICSRCGASLNSSGICPRGCNVSGSGSGNTGSGNSNTGSGLEIFLPLPGGNHECTTNEDCRKGSKKDRVCYRRVTREIFYERKCRDMNDNEKSCVGKNRGEGCALYGNVYTNRGWCTSIAGAPVLTCWSNPIS